MILSVLNNKEDPLMRDFESNIINLYGNSGKEWLKALPARIETFAAQYHLTDLVPISPLSYHYVLSGFQGHQPIILKLGADTDNLRRESAALKAFAGVGAISLIAEERGMLILERAVDGSLKTYFPKREREAVEIACDLMKRLHQAGIPSVAFFPLLEEQLNCLDQKWPIPLSYLQKARLFRHALLGSVRKTVLLHGDLHHDNIVRHGKTWVAIDPKGVIGDPAYEAAAFIRNPLPALLILPNVKDVICDRVNQFSEIFTLPAKLILRWCFVQSVLSWIWNIEDNIETEDDQKLTKLFDDLMN
ncbi:MAG: uncharacterized protein K0R12_1007 [Gammaproteobacteria bacterium]|jgi:streptomycin 6-kinase|nr:uncharacterized protein [Gammaproteobacteria bacterium]